MKLHDEDATGPFVMKLHDEINEPANFIEPCYRSNFHLYFLNAKQILDNMFILVRSETREPTTFQNLKKQYVKVLNNIQGTSFKEDNPVFVDFSNDFGTALVRCGMIKPEDKDKEDFLFTSHEQEYILNKIEKAMNLIKIINPNLHFLIHNVISTIGCVRKKGYAGGSVSTAVGMIWINPLAKWTVVDYADAIVHEFIHNSLFLDDMVNCIFPNSSLLNNPDALVTSTIRKTKRGLDKSFHSAAVAIGLMYFYNALNNQQKVDSFVQPVLKTLLEISKINSMYMTNRGYNINNDMLYILETMDFNIINQLLRLPSNF
ncbi:hypothetical protein CN444_25390 [Bacillus thuringiensis]|nr:hypothetical protein CN444_25390 [Bacillus thuringiensis]